MDIEWDKTKARMNEIKHGVSFTEASAVLNDPMSIMIEDDSTDEERFVNIGIDSRFRILVVVCTYRGNNGVRIISARCATNNERKQYWGER